MRHTCPVCFYDELDEPPDNNFDICPSCGTEFGYDDFNASHDELRKRWIAGGCKWWSQSDAPPDDYEDHGRIVRIIEEALEKHAKTWKALAKL